MATGPPGSGKSTTLSSLEFEVVNEAASQINQELLAAGASRPEHTTDFLDRIVARQRRLRRAARSPVQLHDRSVFCTLALAHYLGRPIPPALADEIRAVRGIYVSSVLFFHPLGQIENTPIRRISYPEAVRFGELHRDVYRQYGFTLIDVPAGPVHQRAAAVCALISDLTHD